MRVAAAGKKTFRERDESGTRGRGLVGFKGDGVAERILNAEARGTRKDKTLLGRAVLAELVVVGILQQDAAKVGFRTEVAGGNSSVECRIGALCGFERAV